MTLLDTNVVIWAHMGHTRAKRLARVHGRRYVSPATVLELQMLLETGHLTLAAGVTVGDLVHDQDWLIDNPPAAAWFERATTIEWTRDPFDRLIVAHAQLRRGGWRRVTRDWSSALVSATRSSCRNIQCGRIHEPRSPAERVPASPVDSHRGCRSGEPSTALLCQLAARPSVAPSSGAHSREDERMLQTLSVVGRLSFVGYLNAAEPRPPASRPSCSAIRT